MPERKIKIGRPPRTNAAELSRNYIRENGPSRLGEIYSSMPQSVRFQITIGGVRNILVRMPDIERYGGIFGFIGQYRDPLKLYPPYAETFLQYALDQGQITEREATNLLNGKVISMTQAHGRLGYLVKKGLLEFDGGRTYRPSPYVIEIMRNRHAHEE